MSQASPFTSLKYMGKRFEDHAIPEELLAGIGRLSDIIRELAKELYFQLHPDRKALPKGFLSGFQLGLSAIHPGSTVCEIRQIGGYEANLFSSDLSTESTLIQKAGQSFVSACDSAENGRPVMYLSPKVLNSLARFGDGLLPDERIEIRATDCEKVAFYSIKARESFSQAARQKFEALRQVSVICSVPEADQRRRTAELQLANSKRIRVSFDEDQHSAVVDGFHGYLHGVRVLVKGLGRYDSRWELIALEPVESIQVVYPTSITDQLARLATLEDGWLDGEGKAPDERGLKWLATAFNDNYPAGYRVPSISPTPEGGVEAEWRTADWSLTLDIDLATKHGWLHSLNLKRDRSYEATLDLANPEAWEKLKMYVQQPELSEALA